MDFLLNVWFWVILAVVFIVAEIGLPGGIVIFLGVAGLIVAICVQLGLVGTWTSALTLWFISSIVLVILLRGLAQKMVGGDSSIANTDEDVAALGEIVEVVETIGPGESKGRVVFRDVRWNAVGDGSEIPAGEKAQIVSRDNITLVVERAPVADEPEADG
jgi:membrane protein implicated in regulation of membrane protease activity|tara:strand:- start:2402 stop:2881 length:480 start_codon:yes stop_codon:yes gene_type:complete